MADIDGIKPESLEFEWMAKYTDGTMLDQNYGVGEEEGEHHFGHIDQSKLESFWLRDKNGLYQYGVDIKNQEIILKNMRLKVEFPRDKNGGIVQGKLVYFRRIRNVFDPAGIQTIVRFAIGLQANIDGVNKQQYLFINSDGTYTLSQQK